MSVEEKNVQFLEDFLEDKVPDSQLAKVEDQRHIVKECENIDTGIIGVRDTEAGFSPAFYESEEELADRLEEYDSEAEGRYFSYISGGDTTICDRRNGDAWITSDRAHDLGH